MKKHVIIASILLAGSAHVGAAELNLTVTSGGQAVITADPGAVVNYEVTGVLSDAANEGLSHFIFDLALEPGGTVPPATQPAALLSFTSVNPDGFGGTVVGDVLRQVGGAQNTLGALSGSVVTGIGHTPTVLATGMVNAPLADGVYTLNASDVLGRAIKQGEDGNGPIWATEWAFGGSMMNLTLVVGNGCLDLAGCADIDNDGIRDDPCVWWSCDGVCNPVDIPFADMGGQFGSCLPDGTADGNDKFHALNCFSNQNTAGTPSYPCESTPPAALNVDAGGPFGDCSPDGVCDGNDAFHALNAFQGTSLCSCTSGPAPDVEPRVVGKAALVLEARQSTVKPGGIVEVDVHLAGPLPDLRGYQLHLGASGDAGAALVDIAVEERDDWIFAGRGAWRAFNIATGQMVAGLDSPGVIASAGGYLATFTYRVSEAASGAVSIGPLLTSESQQGRTFLFSTQTNGKIEISATSASVSVAPAAGSARRTGR